MSKMSEEWSDPSTNDRFSSSDLNSQSYDNTRPKLQPVRVKALMDLCDNEDDESEDAPLDSESDSDSDSPQQLPQDTSLANVLNKTLEEVECPASMQKSWFQQDLKTTLNVLQSNAASNKQEARSNDDNIECKVDNRIGEGLGLTCGNHIRPEVSNENCVDTGQGTHKPTRPINFQVEPAINCPTNIPHSSASSLFMENASNIKAERSINLDSSSRVQFCNTREKICCKEFSNKYATTAEHIRHSTVDNENYASRETSEEQSRRNNHPTNDVQDSCTISNNENQSATLGTRSYGNSLQSRLSNIGSANTKLESLEQQSFSQEESEDQKNMSMICGTSSLLHTVDKLITNTPLKQSSNSMARPNPCFSRRTIIETPQNKMRTDLSVNHGLTPATILSHWSQSVRQTPLQNTNSTTNDKMQDSRNSIHFTPGVKLPEGQRYFNTENKTRRPLADTASSTHRDPTNRHLLQGSQLRKVKEAAANPLKELQENLCNKVTTAKRMLLIPDNEANSKLGVNEQAKENRIPSLLDAGERKEPVIQNKMPENRHTVVSGNSNMELKNESVKIYDKCSNAASKTVSEESKNQYGMISNQNQEQQQQDSRPIANKEAPIVQFSLPASVPKAKENKTIFVKGKEYSILGILGQGMSGEVLRVQNVSNQDLCAVKCVNLRRMDKDTAQGCLQEISMLHKLQAPCVVRMFDYEIVSPMVYVVMEMGDTDLSNLLKSMSKEKQLTPTMILYYWTEMLTAVKHIHDNGVIHSDLKPANFLLVRGRLKLIDFGIASSMNADMTSVVKNCPIGTLNYISPEALMDIGGNSDSPTHNVKYKINYKSDVWSLGCILYSLVYGHTPFYNIRPQWAKVNAITNPKLNISFPTNSPSIDCGNKSMTIPPILIDVMRKCLQHDPKARPTVAELLQVQYVPTIGDRVSTSVPNIPPNVLIKIKHALDEDEWRDLIEVLECKRYT